MVNLPPFDGEQQWSCGTGTVMFQEHGAFHGVKCMTCAVHLEGVNAVEMYQTLVKQLSRKFLGQRISGIRIGSGECSDPRWPFILEMSDDTE